MINETSLRTAGRGDSCLSVQLCCCGYSLREGLKLLVVVSVVDAFGDLHPCFSVLASGIVLILQ